MDIFETARINMVKSQILPNHITNSRLVDVITAVPRHSFVPDDKKEIAYIDGSLPIGYGRYILPPMVFARMLQELELTGRESVLDIACGTGYSSAVLASICKKITAVESNINLASKAHQNLNKLGVNNVIIIGNQLAEGHKEGGPYDAILINGAVAEVPHNLLEQLAENGRLAVILLSSPNSGRLVVYHKTNGNITQNDVFDISLPQIEDF